MTSKVTTSGSGVGPPDFVRSGVRPPDFMKFGDLLGIKGISPVGGLVSIFSPRCWPLFWTIFGPLLVQIWGRFLRAFSPSQRLAVGQFLTPVLIKRGSQKGSQTGQTPDFGGHPKNVHFWVKKWEPLLAIFERPKTILILPWNDPIFWPHFWTQMAKKGVQKWGVFARRAPPNAFDSCNVFSVFFTFFRQCQKVQNDKKWTF